MQSVRFGSENTAIDLGGIGKGILLREADKVLTCYTVANCFISFGGSSILTRGSHPHGDGWPLALRNTSDNAYTFYLHNHAVSISESNPGGSEAHIIHPASRKKVDNNRLTFVQSTCPVIAEVLSTALIIAPVEEAEEIVQSFGAVKAYIFDNSNPDQFKLLYRFG
jgi:thiamine biosynthesis lipoprotein ApbE